MNKSISILHNAEQCLGKPGAKAMLQIKSNEMPSRVLLQIIPLDKELSVVLHRRVKFEVSLEVHSGDRNGI